MLTVLWFNFTANRCRPIGVAPRHLLHADDEGWLRGSRELGEGIERTGRGGVEGAGSYGVALARFLRSRGGEVV